MLNSSVQMRGITAANRQHAVKPVSARPAVTCAASSTWDSWTNYIEKARKGKSVPTPNPAIFSELAVEVANAAKTYRPRFGGGTAGPGTSAPTPSAPRTQVSSAVWSGLQKKLKDCGLAKLQEVSGVKSISAASSTFTTTELGAALATTGAIVEKNGEKTAIVVFLATDASRDVSWSRLEGLILHWAASDKAGGGWSLPPQGWSAIPGKGGVSPSGTSCDSCFEKTSVEGENGTAYSLVLQLPLKGSLSSGGIQYVLKAAAGQNTRWLKDASTDGDFYMDLSQLPATKA